MEQVGGIPGQLPPLASFPTAEIRQNLPPEEWQACLEAWVFCVEFRLRLLPEHFHHFKLSQASSGTSFLSSYFSSWTLRHDSSSGNRPRGEKEQKLHRDGLLLLRRLLLEAHIPDDYSARDLFILLANASAACNGSKLWHDTLQQALQRQQKQISAAVEEMRSHLIKTIALGGTSGYEILQQSIYQITTLAKCLSQAGKIMMTGYDYVDSLTSTYHDPPGKLQPGDIEDLRKLLTENLFVCLKSLMVPPDPSSSLLFDDIYGLKANAEAEAKINPNRPTLLSSLVCSTSFVRHFEMFLAALQTSRGDSILQFLRSYRTKMSYLHPVPRAGAPKRLKGKDKGRAKAGHAPGDMHIHKAAQISQIHELFPDTPTLYVLRLLDHFSDDVEAVTAALLEPESLPADLQNSQSFADHTHTTPTIHSDLASRSTPRRPPSRKNVFDDDDFDKLRISASQVHIGRKEREYEESGAPPGGPSEKAKKKAAIMAALATFDSDDDERDDTYDVADVGGAVDNTVDTDARPRGTRIKEHEGYDVNERTLFTAWRSNPEMFARDSKTRISKSRQQLKQETGMGDEQIEGWAVMLSRDDASLQKLENKYVGPASFGGQQKALRTTKWSASPSGTATATEEETDTDGDGGNGSVRGGALGGSPIRGGRGYGRGRGKTSGPASDAGTQAARKRKEQGRGRGGSNYNRREGRARKMGRGFGNLPPT
jgi:activating signal cointegrator complex subunit 2